MNTERSLCIYVYERMLLGQTQKTSNNLFKTKEDVGYVWNYAVTEILGWTPQQAVMYLDDEIVKMLKLDKTLSVIGVASRKENHLPDYRFVLQYAFPGIVTWDDDASVLDVFKRCAHIGEYINAEKKYEYPKGFWQGVRGIDRGIYLLNYIIDTYYSDMNIIELYDYFAEKKKATLMLKKYALDTPLKYFDSPLHFLHETLKASDMENEKYYENLLSSAVN